LNINGNKGKNMVFMNNTQKYSAIDEAEGFELCSVSSPAVSLAILENNQIHWPEIFCEIENIRPGFDLILADFSSAETRRDFLRYLDKGLVLSVILDGETTLVPDDSAPVFGHLFSSEPGPAETVCWISDLTGEISVGPGQALLSVSLVLSLEYLKMLESQFDLAQLCQSIRSASGGLMLYSRKNLGAQKRQIAVQMLKSPLPDIYRRLFRQGKAMELLAIFLSQLTPVKAKCFSLGDCDLKRLNEARGILENNFRDPPRLKDLSRLCGLNESKLKLGFKYYFGQTFSDIIRKERMNQALSILSGSEKPINLVANLVGYCNISHFIDAFRVEFGLTPGQMRRLNRQPQAVGQIPECSGPIIAT
jgi:AraC-like DNA-binding protein